MAVAMKQSMASACSSRAARPAPAVRLGNARVVMRAQQPFQVRRSGVFEQGGGIACRVFATRRESKAHGSSSKQQALQHKAARRHPNAARTTAPMTALNGANDNPMPPLIAGRQAGVAQAVPW